MPTVHEQPVPVLEIVEPEPNPEGVFHDYFSGSKTASFGSSSEPAVFYSFSRFQAAGFVRCRPGFGSKFFEHEPNHGSKIDGFGSEP